MDSELDVDDDITLPEDTIKILEEFLKERAQMDKSGVVAEDWNLSQFWYNKSTKRVFANIVSIIFDEFKEKQANSGWASLRENFCCALLSAPSLYESVKEVCPKGEDNLHFLVAVLKFIINFQLKSLNSTSVSKVLARIFNFTIII